MKMISKNSVTNVVICGSLIVSLSGCVSSIASAAGGIVGGVAGTALTVVTGGAVNGSALGYSAGSSLFGSAVDSVTTQKKQTPSQAGLAHGQSIVASMATNPAVLGVGAIANAQSEINQQQNLQAFKKLNTIMNDPNTNKNMQNRVVNVYNQQNGTNFKSMQDLQDSVKIQGYNKSEGTSFITFSEVREDYNKKHNTSFKTDKELRDYIAKNRGRS